jgi:type II secretory pathway pseudopilin PulG
MKSPARGIRRGFTLVEAVTATTLTAVCGSALLLGLSSSLRTTQNNVDQAIAAGMAQQLLDEISGKFWCNPGTNSMPTTLGPTGTDAGPTRQNYKNIADYNGYSCQPPQDMWGIPLGTDNGAGGTRPTALQVNSSSFELWQQQVKVYYVSSANFAVALPAGQTSDYRAVEVRIFINEPGLGLQQLALARRIFAYVYMP